MIWRPTWGTKKGRNEKRKQARRTALTGATRSLGERVRPVALTPERLPAAVTMDNSAKLPSISSPGCGYNDGYRAQTNGDQDRNEGSPKRYVASHGPRGTHSSSSGGSTPRVSADCVRPQL
ncbi:hypothetical protein HPB47_009254 [Ixodes persulcatus]|uniref:Uncharacterized protein n=1 Tax=Ixodes persulcatus TaxID=34615 RepID=A0AC60P2Q3_IXOPE|nr:hypothetical protein HPB47_009254 [Ixodes persulcatus]